MLPTEVFAEAVAFLRLFDLSELSVTNALCSSLAINASARIRWEQFSDLDFYISDTWVAIYRAFGICDRFDFVACLTFSNEPDLAEFISAAFPNCIFNGVGIWRHATKHTLNAIGRVADSFIITEALGHYRDMSPDDSLNLIRKFRKVKVSFKDVECSMRFVATMGNGFIR